LPNAEELRTRNLPVAQAAAPAADGVEQSSSPSATTDL
jgi:hypothetical protein